MVGSWRTPSPSHLYVERIGVVTGLSATWSADSPNDSRRDPNRIVHGDRDRGVQFFQQYSVHHAVVAARVPDSQRGSLLVESAWRTVAIATRATAPRRP